MICVCCLTPHQQTVGAKQTEQQPDLRSVCGGEMHRSAPSFPKVQLVYSFILQGASVIPQCQTLGVVCSQSTVHLYEWEVSPDPFKTYLTRKRLPGDSERTQMGPVAADAQHLNSAMFPCTCC